MTARVGDWVLAERIKSAWRNGAAPDAAAAIAANPELANRSIIVDLAYEEYLIRDKAGAAPDAVSFARRFDDLQSCVLSMIEAHRLLDAHPEWLAPPEADWPAVGETLEGLEVRAELGRGAFGRAYLAFDPVIRRPRVIKLAPGGLAEARVIGAFAHPNIVDVLWTKPVGPRTAVCMPFVGGTTLADAVIARRPEQTANDLLKLAAAQAADVPVKLVAHPVVQPGDSYLVGACAIAARIAAAVDHLHENDVVHGDIKPTNVILEPGGSPRLIDFNLAAGEEPALAIRGTPAYMAPELLDATLQARSPDGLDGQKADLFALGVTLLELLTGRHPYRWRSDGTLASLATAIHRGRFELPRGLPRNVIRVLVQCLAADPAERPASAKPLQEELERFVLSKRSQPRRLRRRALTAAGIIALVALTSMTPLAKPAVDRPPETPAEFYDRGLKLLREGKADAARSDFNLAYELGRDPYALAMAAHCYALSGNHAVAARWYEQALAGGADTAVIRNNLGVVLLQQDRSSDALLHLDAAVSRDPEMQAARVNRLRLRLQEMLKRGLIPDSIAEDDAAVALRGPVVTGELHRDAAHIFAIGSQREPTFKDRALSELEAAVAGGVNPKLLIRDFCLKRFLSSEPRFQKLTSLPIPAGSPPHQPRFVEPSRY
jgi:serine/threonine protein kinase